MRLWPKNLLIQFLYFVKDYTKWLRNMFYGAWKSRQKTNVLEGFYNGLLLIDLTNALCKLVKFDALYITFILSRPSPDFTFNVKRI